MAGVRECVRDVLSKGEGVLHNEVWGDFLLEMGRVGKKGYGLEHIYEKRAMEGVSDDEVAFVIVTALKAAEQENYAEKKGNKLLFDKFGVRAVVAINNDNKKIITGFVLVNKEDEIHAALPHENSYALNELGRVHLMGASLEKALQKFDRIVNENPEDWEEIISMEIGKLKIKQEARARGDITMSLEIWDEEHEEQVKVRERKLFTLLNDIRRETKRFERVFELDEAEKRIRAKAKPSEKEKVRESREKRMRRIVFFYIEIVFWF